MSYASLKIRLLASLLDGVIFLLLIAVLFYYVSLQQTLPQVVSASVLSLIILLNPLLIFSSVLFTHYFGGSPGKLLTGLRVVSENDKKLSFKRIIFRQTIGYSFSWIFFGLGYLSVIKDAKKQAWHDKTVGSVVKAKNNMLIIGSALFILLSLISIAIFIKSAESLSKGSLVGDLKKAPPIIRETDGPIGLLRPTDTAWKTYSNTRYNFTLRYPDNWILNQSNDDYLTLRFEGPKTGKPTLDNFAQISFSVQETTEPLSELVERDFNRMRENEGQPVNYSEIKRINIEGGDQAYSFSCPFLVPQECIYIPLNSGYIKVLTNYSDDQNRGYSKIIDNILSTFKFIE